MKLKLQKLNSRGFSHHLLAAVIVVGAAVGGTYYLVASHADPVTPRANTSSTSASNLLFVDNHDGYIYSETSSGVEQKLVDGQTPMYIDNGAKILLTFYNSNNGLYEMNADGSNVKKLISGVFDYPTWSEAAQLLAYTKPDTTNLNTNIGLYVWNFSTGKSTKIFDSGPNIGIDGFQISPDGKKILMNTTNLSVINSDGTGLKNLPIGSSALNDYGAVGAWSPDSNNFVYVSYQTASYNTIETYNLTTQQTTKLFTPGTGENIGTPQWSPDGTEIAFVSAQAGNPAQLNTMPASSNSAKTTVAATFPDNTSGTMGQALLSWSSNSKKLAVVDPVAGTTYQKMSVRVINPGVSNKVVHTSDSGGIYDLNWTTQ